MEAVPALLASESPKQAFRAAESAMSRLNFRPPREGLDRAAGRTRLALADLGVEAQAAIYLQDRGEHRRVGGNESFPDWLADADRESVAAEAAFYGASPACARGIWRLGARREWIVAWRFDAPISPDVVVMMEAFRLVVSQRLLEAGFSGILAQAAAIQRSLLPDPLPLIAGFDLAARSVPAEEVGGDVYDALPLASDALAFAIGDVAGHGLPAALEARDVLVGLRMGAARHMKIDATIEKLNGILCRTTLSSRFVSLVYGELDSDGRFQFVNAGHPQPILVNPGGTRMFPETGLVLGVSKDARHRVRHGEIAPGGVLVLVTDGILETKSPSGEEFGAARVAFLVRALNRKPAAWIVSALFEALIDHSRETSPSDDATALVIKREE